MVNARVAARQRCAESPRHKTSETMLRAADEAGELGVDPEDELPQNFRLEPMIRKRFGARWIRLSRVVSIEETAMVTVTGQRVFRD